MISQLVRKHNLYITAINTVTYTTYTHPHATHNIYSQMDEGMFRATKS